MYFIPMKSLLYVLLFTGISITAQTPSVLQFSSPVTVLDTLQQGETKRVVLQAKNTASSPIVLETVLSQNSGPENFKFPQKIAPGQTFQVEYTLQSAYMEGDFTHTIVLVEPNGTPHLTYVAGHVKAPIWFSEKIHDLGYYTSGSSVQWTFYAWNPQHQKLALALSPESASEFTAQITPVQLHTESLDNIREGGKVPGLKITLKPKTLQKNTGKSIRKIVSFRSKTFPQATPEVLVIGYWK